MWLSIILSVLVLFVIWVETDNVSVTDNNIYTLNVWSRDPKYEIKRKSNVNFRSERKIRKMRPVFPFHNETWNADMTPGRRIRKPLKDRIHERVYAAEGRSKKEKDVDAHIRSTRITPMRLVEQTTGTPKKDTFEEVDKKKKPNYEPLNEDMKEEDHSESKEKLSVYSMKKNMRVVAKELREETNITINVLGRTFEYNDIIILKMTEVKSEITKYFRSNNDAKYIDEVPEKKIIFIVHGLVTMGIQNVPCLSRRKKFMQLLNYYLEHLDKFDIFLIPVANPDGFVTTYNVPVQSLLIDMFSSRYWNKNTSPQTSCNGVNIDRNFDVAWSEAGQVSSCSQQYPGPNAFSEPESRAVREVFHRYSHKMAAYIHIHAGTFSKINYKGEAVLYPKGYTDTTSDDDKYMDMKGEIDEIMRNASFQRTVVAVDSLYRWYGKITGTSVDYAAAVFGIPFAMEFVMQTYDSEPAQDAALTVIWKRVIDAIFNFIHKKGQSTNDI